MARPKKSQGVSVSSDASIEDKVEELNTLKIIDDLQKQIEQLKKQVLEKEEKPIFNEAFGEDEFESVKINQDDYIKVISLCPYQLNLSTLPGGKGKIFSFPSFGATKRILYSDLVQILESFQHFLNEGYFYIADKRVIRRHGLDDIYTRILTKEKIEMILDGNSQSDIVSMMKSATRSQQEIIIQMLIDRRIAGQEYDLNLWDKLSRVSGVNIQQKYEDTKAFVDSLKE